MFRYRSYIYDYETSLYYLQSRYYDAEAGRFINADGYVSTGQGLLGNNMYAYCGNNPVNMVDYTGKFWEEIKNWVTNAIDWLCDNAINDDGSISLYDNTRTNSNTNWHEQLLAINYSNGEVDLKSFKNTETRTIGIGKISADLCTGGWEYGDLDISLFDFGHAELGAEYGNRNLHIGALASMYSPSVSFNLFGFNVEIGLEFGAIGGAFDLRKNKGFEIKYASGIGFSLKIE